MSRLFVVVALIFSFNRLNAQMADSVGSAKPTKISYFNAFFFGTLSNDERDITLALRTTHGVRFGRLAAGASLGYDTFDGFESVPLTGHISFDYLKVKSTTFYVSLDGGIAWLRLSEKKSYLSYSVDHGTVINPMAGIRHTKGPLLLYVALGYNKQRYEYSAYPLYDSSTTPPVSYTSLDVSRFSFMIGLGFR